MIFGAGGANLVEHGGSTRIDPRLSTMPFVKKSYSVQWKRSTLDVAELAQKRFIEGWSAKRLSQHFSRTENAIHCACQKLKGNQFKHPGIKAA